YYRLLNKYIDQINATPSEYNSLFTIRRENYRDVMGYLELVGEGKRLDYQRIGRQLREYITALKQKLPYHAYDLLLRKTDNFAKLDELYVYLSKIAREYDLGLSAEFPDLERFFAYIEKGQNVNPILLIKEEKRLAEEIRIGLAQDISELEVSFASDFFGYFEDYLSNSLSAEDYDYFGKRFGQFREIWGKYAFRNRLPGLQADFALLDEYYKVNNARNDYFIRNILGDYRNPSGSEPETGMERNISRTVESLGTAEEVLVVVTGGFHTEGLERYLDERRISYLEVTPNVTQDTKRSSEIYMELAEHQARVFKDTFGVKERGSILRGPGPVILGSGNSLTHLASCPGFKLSPAVHPLRPDALALWVLGNMPRNAQLYEIARSVALKKLAGIEFDYAGVQRAFIGLKDLGVTVTTEGNAAVFTVNGRTFRVTKENGRPVISEEGAAAEQDLQAAARPAGAVLSWESIAEAVNTLESFLKLSLELGNLAAVPALTYEGLKSLGVFAAGNGWSWATGDGLIYEIDEDQGLSDIDGVSRDTVALLLEPLQEMLRDRQKRKDIVDDRASRSKLLRIVLAIDFVRELAIEAARLPSPQQDAGSIRAPQQNDSSLTRRSTYELGRKFFGLFGWRPADEAGRKKQDRAIEIVFAPAYALDIVLHTFDLLRGQGGVNRYRIGGAAGIWAATIMAGAATAALTLGPVGAVIGAAYAANVLTHALYNLFFGTGTGAGAPLTAGPAEPGMFARAFNEGKALLPVLLAGRLRELHEKDSENLSIKAVLPLTKYGVNGRKAFLVELSSVYGTPFTNVIVLLDSRNEIDKIYVGKPVKVSAKVALYRALKDKKSPPEAEGEDFIELDGSLLDEKITAEKEFAGQLRERLVALMGDRSSALVNARATSESGSWEILTAPSGSVILRSLVRLMRRGSQFRRAVQQVLGHPAARGFKLIDGVVMLKRIDVEGGHYRRGERSILMRIYNNDQVDAGVFVHEMVHHIFEQLDTGQRLRVFEHFKYRYGAMAAILQSPLYAHHIPFILQTGQPSEGLVNEVFAYTVQALVLDSAFLFAIPEEDVTFLIEMGLLPQGFKSSVAKAGFQDIEEDRFKAKVQKLALMMFPALKRSGRDAERDAEEQAANEMFAKVLQLQRPNGTQKPGFDLKPEAYQRLEIKPLFTPLEIKENIIEIKNIPALERLSLPEITEINFAWYIRILFNPVIPGFIKDLILFLVRTSTQKPEAAAGAGEGALTVTEIEPDGGTIDGFAGELVRAQRRYGGVAQGRFNGVALQAVEGSTAEMIVEAYRKKLTESRTNWIVARSVSLGENVTEIQPRGGHKLDAFIGALLAAQQKYGGVAQGQFNRIALRAVEGSTREMIEEAYRKQYNEPWTSGIVARSVSLGENVTRIKPAAEQTIGDFAGALVAAQQKYGGVAQGVFQGVALWAAEGSTREMIEAAYRKKLAEPGARPDSPGEDVTDIETEGGTIDDFADELVLAHQRNGGIAQGKFNGIALHAVEGLTREMIVAAYWKKLEESRTSVIVARLVSLGENVTEIRPDAGQGIEGFAGALLSVWHKYGGVAQGKFDGIALQAVKGSTAEMIEAAYRKKLEESRTSVIAARSVSLEENVTEIKADGKTIDEFAAALVAAQQKYGGIARGKFNGAILLAAEGTSAGAIGEAYN
ncbi:MAG: hypothetical protein ACYC5N_08130, partial [Endomicrobiales bacterium]